MPEADDIRTGSDRQPGWTTRMTSAPSDRSARLDHAPGADRGRSRRPEACNRQSGHRDRLFSRHQPPSGPHAAQHQESERGGHREVQSVKSGITHYNHCHRRGEALREMTDSGSVLLGAHFEPGTSQLQTTEQVSSPTAPISMSELRY